MPATTTLMPAALDGALRWATTIGVTDTQLRATWTYGQAAQVPIGPSWHTVRTTATIGRAAICHLSARGVLMGPICAAGPLIEFVVQRAPMPLPLIAPYARHVAQWQTTGHMWWPAPGADGAHRWIVPPHAPTPHTPLTPLCAALSAAATHYAADVRPSSRLPIGVELEL
ncbi:hypothetical protein [Streptomyces sp. NPDC002067]